MGPKHPPCSCSSAGQATAAVVLESFAVELGTGGSRSSYLFHSAEGQLESLSAGPRGYRSRAHEAVEHRGFLQRGRFCLVDGHSL